TNYNSFLKSFFKIPTKKPSFYFTFPHYWLEVSTRPQKMPSQKIWMRMDEYGFLWMMTACMILYNFASE
ncbi:MAG: hypothetical protein MJZ63_08865, partial [Muribaculaceae bacterium]|nr:hypothetical protein [Muribaculaceae bacterium]